MSDSPTAPVGCEGVPLTRRHLHVVARDVVEEQVGDVVPDDRDDGSIMCW
ncbi:hypothetical protein [Mycobacterium sp.]